MLMGSKGITTPPPASLAPSLWVLGDAGCWPAGHSLCSPQAASCRGCGDQAGTAGVLVFCVL